MHFGMITFTAQSHASLFASCSVLTLSQMTRFPRCTMPPRSHRYINESETSYRRSPFSTSSQTANYERARTLHVEDRGDCRRPFCRWAVGGGDSRHRVKGQGNARQGSTYPARP